MDNDIQLHVSGRNVSKEALQDPAFLDAVRKMGELLKIKELIRTGHAAVMPNGNIVDRREHHEAVPIPPHQQRAEEQTP